MLSQFQLTCLACKAADESEKKDCKFQLFLYLCLLEKIYTTIDQGIAFLFLSIYNICERQITIGWQE